MKNLILLSSIAVTFISCDVSKKANETKVGNIEQSIQNEKRLTIDTEYINLEVSPRKDFFNYANGRWLANNPVPASESRWGSFNELDQSNKKKLAVILSDAKNTNAPKGTMMQILGDYYASYIDMDRRNELGNIFDVMAESLRSNKHFEEHQQLHETACKQIIHIGKVN